MDREITSSDGAKNSFSSPLGPEHIGNPTLINASELFDTRNKKLDEIDDAGQGSLKIVDQMVESFKQDLLENVNQFKRVFITAKGSIYFVSSDDSSLRIREEAEGVSKVQPIVKKQILIDKETANKIVGFGGDGNRLIGWPLTKQPYAVGDIPFEFEVMGLPPIGYDEDEHALTIHGDVQGVNASGYRVGHAITDIVL